jgi:hypothetical protein
MATFYGTCGHELNDACQSLALKAVRYDQECGWLPAIDYVVYCQDCAKYARANHAVLANEQEQHDWLTRPLC